MGWFSPQWQYRKLITIPAAQVGAGGVTNFPVHIIRTDADFAKAQPDGDDFVLTQGDGVTALKTELEAWDGTSALILPSKVASLSSVVANALYLYYGNPSAASQHDPTNVWDANYDLVSHDGGLTDSTSNGRNGTNHGTTEDASGKIGVARAFASASSQYIDLTTWTGIGGSANRTCEAWVKNAGPATNERWLGWGGTTATGNAWRCAVNGATDAPRAEGHNCSRYGVTDVCDGTWHHVVMVLDGSNMSNVLLYVDGVVEGSYTTADNALNTLTTNTVKVGSQETPAGYWNGSIDELRVSSLARSAAWIETEYNNQSAPGTFLTFGAEETFSGGLFQAPFAKPFRDGAFV